MDLYLAREFYAPMGLQRTMFLPLTKFTKAEIMPTASTDFLRRQDICGYVHDETAACMGGAVSYTHLDVYKRQALLLLIFTIRRSNATKSCKSCKLF